MTLPLSMTPTGLVGRATTAGAAEQTLNLSQDGAAAAATIPVPTGNVLRISDILFSAEAAANWRVQKTTDGIAFSDLFVYRLNADGSSGVVDLGSPVAVQGGPNVAVRVRVETPGGAAAVLCSLLGGYGNA